jgi:hypothetical protein
VRQIVVAAVEIRAGGARSSDVKRDASMVAPQTAHSKLAIWRHGLGAAVDSATFAGTVMRRLHAGLCARPVDLARFK